MLSVLAAITPALGLDYCKKQCGEVDKKSQTIQEQGSGIDTGNQMREFHPSANRRDCPGVVDLLSI